MSYFIFADMRSKGILLEKEQHAETLDDLIMDFFDYLYELVHPSSNKVDAQF